MTYVGFDDRDIRGSDRATGIHVFAEIRASDRYAHLRLGQTDIRGINGAVPVHIADQDADGNGNVTRVWYHHSR